jgi:hypothetical protein
MWAQIGMAAMDFMSGMNNYALAKAQAEISTRLSRVNAESENKVRAARNERSKAQGDLARWAQSVNNQHVLDEGASASEATIVNFFRGGDASLTGNFEQSVRYAEQAGMQAAQAGAAGVRGGVVDSVNQATALRNARASQQVADYSDMRTFDTSRRVASIWNQTVGGLDNSVLLDDMDYNTSYAQEAKQPSMWAMVLEPMAKAALSAIGGGMGGGAGGDISSNAKKALDASSEKTTGDFARFDRGYSAASSGFSFSFSNAASSLAI